MIRIQAILVLALSVALAVALGARAQVSASAPERTGTVTGQVVNGTPGGAVPGGLAVMLHAWDDSQETVMLDGTADSAGAFRFDDVPMQAGWVFMAMLTHEAVTYFSEAVPATADTTALQLPLTIFQSTGDDSAVIVTQLHAFFEFEPGEMLVSEVYVLSNAGDRAVVGGQTPADGQSATLQFALPAGANKVKFEGEASRFVITPDGFADLGPVLPGQGTAQVFVSYSLPYSPGMTLAHDMNYPVMAATFLVNAGSGVALAGDGVGDPIPRQLESGKTFDIYSASPLSAGSQVAVTLTGEPVYRSASEMGGEMSEGRSRLLAGLPEQAAIPAAGACLGLVLIGLGVWWWRRSAQADAIEAASDLPNEWGTVLHGLADLDQAHEAGRLAEAAYQRQRSEPYREGQGNSAGKRRGRVNAAGGRIETGQMAYSPRAGFWLESLRFVIDAQRSLAMKRYLLPLLLLAALALTACSGSQSRVGSTVLSLKAQGMKYNPATLEVTAGQPVTITFENADSVEHDFSILEIPVVIQATAEPMEGHDMGNMSMDPQLHMVAAAGGTATLEFTPSKPGTYEFFCTVPGHKEAGMVGTLVVNAP
jgi:plastocyanin